MFTLTLSFTGSTQAHEDRNLARKLTPAERKEKKLQKLVGDAQEGEATLVSVYRVRRLKSPQMRFKVHVNAEVRPPVPHFIGLDIWVWSMCTNLSAWDRLLPQTAKSKGRSAEGWH